MAKRRATLASGGARPSWKVMAIQVVPQMATAAAKSRGVETAGPGPGSGTRVEPLRVGAERAGAQRPLVHRAERALQAPIEQAEVARPVEPRRDVLQVVVAEGPVERVEAGEVERARVLPQRLLPLEVEVVVEVGERELARRPVDRVAVSQAGEVRLGDGAPAPAQAEHGEHVVVVAH